MQPIARLGCGASADGWSRGAEKHALVDVGLAGEPVDEREAEIGGVVRDSESNTVRLLVRVRQTGAERRDGRLNQFLAWQGAYRSDSVDLAPPAKLAVKTEESDRSRAVSARQLHPRNTRRSMLVPAERTG